MRRIYLLLFGITLLVACGRTPPPSVVLLVTIDTLRADHTSVFGYDLDTTPNLRALAARGTAFETCYAQHVETGPSITSTMTSLYPREIGVRENGRRLSGEFRTMAEAFRDAGYDTAAFVSTAVLMDKGCGLRQGFGLYDEEMNAPNFGHENAERRAGHTVDRAIAWLAKKGAKPKFLWVHLYDPHGLYDPPDRGRPFYRDTGRADLRPEQVLAYQRYRGSLDPDDYIARYDGEIFEADRHLGRLFSAVGTDAMVAVSADHGESLGEDDYWFRHGSLLNPASLHVPLVIVGGRAEPGTRHRALVRNLDIAPTLLDLAGLDPLPDARGRSLFRRHPVPEEASYAEARRVAGISDRTGIDTGYKVSLTTSTAHQVYRPGREACPNEALEEWMEATGDQMISGPRPPEVDNALRGSGYIR